MFTVNSMEDYTNIIDLPFFVTVPVIILVEYNITYKTPTNNKKKSIPQVMFLPPVFQLQHELSTKKNVISL